MSQGDLGRFPRLFNRQYAKLANRKATAPPVGIAVLDDEGLGAAGFGTEAKPSDFVIPNEVIGPRSLGRIHRSFCQLGHWFTGKHWVSRSWKTEEIIGITIASKNGSI